jgi:F-type H+-transporting ATPase subunit c
MNVIGIAIGFCMGLVGLGIALGQGRGLGNAVESIAKQPEAANDIRTTLIVGMAIMETMGVLTFVIAIILSGKL